MAAPSSSSSFSAKPPQQGAQVSVISALSYKSSMRSHSARNGPSSNYKERGSFSKARTDVCEATERREALRYPVESTNAGPLLEDSGYRQQRPLSPDTIRRRNDEIERQRKSRIGLALKKDSVKKGLTRPCSTERGSAGGKIFQIDDKEESEEQVLYTRYERGTVVDGVDDLREATAGLFSRHVDQLDTTGDEREYLGVSANEYSPSTMLTQKTDYFKSNPIYPKLSGAGTTVDDRVTPQTLHTLIRSNRGKVNTMYPPQKPKKYYAFQVTGGTESTLEKLKENLQNEESNAAPAGGAHHASAGGRNQGDHPKPVATVNSKKRKGQTRETAADFLASTNHTRVTGKNESLLVTKPTMLDTTNSARNFCSSGTFGEYSTSATYPGFGAADLNSTGGASSGARNFNWKKAVRRTRLRNENEEYSQTQMMYTGVRHMEPPGLSAAHTTSYYAKLEDAEKKDDPNAYYSVSPDYVGNDASSPAGAAQQQQQHLSGRFTSSTAAPLLRGEETAQSGTGPLDGANGERDPFNLVSYFKSNTSRGRTIALPALPGDSLGAVGGPPMSHKPPPLSSSGVENASAGGAGDKNPATGTARLRDNDPAMHVMTASDAQEVLARLDESQQIRKDGPATRQLDDLASLDFAVTSANRGDEVGLVNQLVRFFGTRAIQNQAEWDEVRARHNLPEVRVPTQTLLREYMTATTSQTAEEQKAHQKFDETVLQTEPPFSFVEVTLSVSREYEKLAQQLCPPHQHKNSSTFSRQRQAVIARLSSFDSTLVPQQYWIATSRSRGTFRGDTEKSKEGGGDAERATDGDVASSEAAGEQSSEKGSRAAGNTEASRIPKASVPLPHNASNGTSGGPIAPSAVLFPSAKPTGRAQVYLLAATLDEMFGQDPRLLPTLADPAIAYRILPSAEEPLASGANTEGDGAVPYEEYNNPLLDEVLISRSQEAYDAYTNCSSNALHILEVGFTELVRQVASECVERGALLDALKQMVLDVAESHIRVLQYTKKRAFTEAVRRREIRASLEEARRSMDVLTHDMECIKNENAELRAEHDALLEKATRLDELTARVEAKRKRFETHDDCDHALLLKELEQDLLNSAGEALGELYNAKLDMEKRERGLEDGTGSSEEGRHQEAPSNYEPRKRMTDNKDAMQRLYTESYTLLGALQRATDSVDTVCAPLYNSMQLAKVSAKGNVGSARWAVIARQVGSFEKVKRHRQRVFEVFCEWCDECQRRRDEEERQEVKGGTFLEEGTDEGAGNSELLHASAASFMGSIDSNDDLMKRLHEKRALRAQQDARNLATQERLKGKTTQSTLKANRLITAEDLKKMEVFDCTENEVNALFARDFDFKSFLHPQYEPPSPNFTLELSDVAALMSDVEVALEEITVRMNAMSKSAIVRKGAEPPMQPPAHPQEPCPLCARFDRERDEKRRRQEVMQIIAQEVKARMEEVKTKCQKAESEREEARAEARRCTQALERQNAREEAFKRQLEELVKSSRGRAIAPNKLKAVLSGAGVAISPTLSPSITRTTVRVPTIISPKAAERGEEGSNGGTSPPSSALNIPSHDSASGAVGAATTGGILRPPTERASRATASSPAPESPTHQPSVTYSEVEDNESSYAEDVSPKRRSTLPPPENRARRETREFRKSQSSEPGGIGSPRDSTRRSFGGDGSNDDKHSSGNESDAQ